MKKDNIEEIYSELKSFAKEPPKELWDNIEARLHPKKKRRAAFWFWGSAAAILVLMLGYVFRPTNVEVEIPINEPVKEITDTKQSENGANILEPDSKKNNEGIVTDETSKDSTERGSKDTNEALKKALNNSKLVDRDYLDNKNQNQSKEKSDAQNLKEKLSNTSEIANATNNYAQNSDQERNLKNNELIPDLQNNNKSLIDNAKETVVVGVDSIAKENADAKLDLYKELMAENNNEKDSVKTDVASSSKWSVEVLGGLSNTASEASFQGTAVNTSAQNDFVYSFKVGYAISDKLLIKTGVGKNILGQQINNIAYASTDASLASDGGQAIVSDESLVFFGSSSEFAGNDGTSTEFTDNGTLQQQLDYVQVPLEVFYKVLAKEKYDISMGVGGNVNFITNNRAYLNDEEIGENIGVVNTVFGATLNTNVSYKLTEKTLLFIEPSYNYFQKPIDNSAQDFKNTQLRVLFGLQLKL
ncbi:MAG: hypothetical protein KDD26_03055 [Winogradskyella sp.]|nr:hypothetical protein [Winogradskyella sp.]